MALQRWIRALVREWRSRAGAWRALVWATSLRKHNKAASPVPEEFGVSSFLVPPRVPEGCASVLTSPHAWVPSSGNQGCVNRYLCPSPHWKAVGNDLNSLVILGVNVVNVEVNDSGVGGHPGSCFPAHSCRCSLEGPPPRLRKIPAWAQAARWSPKRSRARRHRQKRLVRGSGRRKRRRSSCR